MCRIDEHTSHAQKGDDCIPVLSLAEVRYLTWYIRFVGVPQTCKHVCDETISCKPDLCSYRASWVGCK